MIQVIRFSMLVLLLIATSGYAATYVVTPDGTGDFATIQDAVDGVVDGDTILLADGTYTGIGNRDVDYSGRAITIKSQSGNREACIIDCEGGLLSQHRAFLFISGETVDAVLEGLTITGGFWRVDLSAAGGAIQITSGSTPTVRDCRFVGNESEFSGGAINIDNAGLVIIDSEFSDNETQHWGGGIAGWNQSTATIDGCLFVNNRAREWGHAMTFHNQCDVTFTRSTAYDHANVGSEVLVFSEGTTALVSESTIAHNPGGAIAGVFANVHITIENTIIAFNFPYVSVFLPDVTTTAEITCTDIYGNWKNWEDDIADQLGIRGNFEQDPMFCCADYGDLSLQPESPCLPGQNPMGEECGLVGAWDITDHECGSGCVIVGVADGTLAPSAIPLLSSEPNPFHGSTSITYVLPEASTGLPVSLRIFNTSGRLIRALVDSPQSIGTHEVNWAGRNDNGANVPSGVYFYELRVGDERVSRRVVLLR